MLRGPSRHEFNKQSVKDTDRDRQREQQRKERAQMLPDDKEVSAGSQDLFSGPIKVKPSIDDTTSVQIRNSLGNFEQIRRVIDNPVPPPPQGLAGYLSTSHPRNPPLNPSHPPTVEPTPSLQSSTSSSSYRPNSYSSHQPILPESKSHNNFPHQQQRSSHSFHVNHHSSSTSLSGPVGNNNINSNSTNSSSTSLSGYRLPNQNNKVPQVPSYFNSSGPILNPTSNHQFQKPSNKSYFDASNNSTVDVKVDVGDNSYNSASVFSGSNNTSEPVPIINKDAKSNSGYKSAVFPNNSNNKRPPAERVDSIEVESILKEMTDVVAPLSAIQTPVKDCNKKLPPRRSSKSEEKIVQSIIKTEAKLPPPPVQKMESSAESSSSYETDSDSESEDSASSASHGDADDKSDNLGTSSNLAPTTGSPTTKWDLSSFLKKDGIVDKSPKPEVNSGLAFGSFYNDHGTDDTASIHRNHERLDNVTSSTVSNKTHSPSPLENNATAPLNVLDIRTKPPARMTRGNSNSRPEPHIPAKPVPPTTIPNKGPTAYKPEKVSSLSASSSEDEEEPPPPVVPLKAKRKSVATNNRAPQSTDKKSTTSGATATKRPRTSGAANARNSASAASRLKSEGESSPEGKGLMGAANAAAGGGKGGKNNQDKNKTDTLKKLFRFGGNKPSANKVQSPNLESDLMKPPPPLGKPSPNRVSAKGNPNPPVSLQNGEILPPENKNKKDAVKDRSSSSQSQNKRQKLSGSAKTSPEKLKEESAKTALINSSLIVRIPLEKLKRKPPLASSSFGTFITPSIPPSVKVEKDGKGGGKSQAPSTAGSKGGSHNSSRVGSSSDPSVVQPHDLIGASSHSLDRDVPMCSDSERLSPLGRDSKKRPKKRSRASPKKTKPTKKGPPDSRTKLEGELSDGEVSSANVLGYAPCDSITRTPPIDPDVVQAPDSSLNPPHLPSPFVQPQVQYFSYFEKNDIRDDLLSRDHDYYLEEAKQLKHKADQEKTSTTQASMYLEAGLFFILTGINMERVGPGSNSNNTASYTMYRDTLTLIQYIGNRWRGMSRSVPPDIQLQEAKIITLSMRCQALLFCKLYKMKMKETRDMVSHMHEYFSKTAIRESMIVNSPQLSTPSPHSPTSSPAGSSGVVQHTPPAHHQQNTNLPIPRSLYNQMQKQCINTYNCIMAHDTWEQADQFVSRYRLEEFFIGIDRHLGPLTLHSTLVDLVRYVRHGLQLINGS